MKVKNTCRVKLHSIAVVVDSDVRNVTSSKNVITIEGQNGAFNTFAFDECLNVNETTFVEKSFEKLNSAVNMSLLGFNSTMLLYAGAESKGDDSMESSVCLQLIRKLFVPLANVSIHKKDGDNSIMRTVSYAVSVKCFEIIENQVNDLLVEKSSDKAASSSNLKVRERRDHTVLVEGVCSIECHNADSASEIITNALRRRSLLATYVSLDEGVQRQKAQNLAVIGALSNLFIQFNIHQTVSVDGSPVLSKQAILEVVSLSASETLSYETVSSAERMIYISQADLMTFKNSKDSLDSKALSTLTLNNALKSLSTLARVVQALKSNASDVTSTVSSTSNKQQHVPYRDSLLTRLLRRSLHGNCYMCMLTVLRGNAGAANADSIRRVLRFAAEIGNLYNYISINEQEIRSMSDGSEISVDCHSENLQGEQVVSDDVVYDDTAAMADDDEIDLNADKHDNTDSSAAFASLFDLLQNDMERLSGDLSKLNVDLFSSPIFDSMYSQPKNYKNSAAVSKTVGELYSADSSGITNPISEVNPFGGACMKSIESVDVLTAVNCPNNSITEDGASGNKIVVESNLSNSVKRVRSAVEDSRLMPESIESGQNSVNAAVGQTSLLNLRGASNSSKLLSAVNGAGKKSNSSAVTNTKNARNITSNAKPATDKSEKRTTNAKVPHKSNQPPSSDGTTMKPSKTLRSNSQVKLSSSSGNIFEESLSPSMRAGQTKPSMLHVTSATVLAASTPNLPPVQALPTIAMLSSSALQSGPLPDVMTESRRTIIKLNIFNGGVADEAIDTTDTSSNGNVSNSDGKELEDDDALAANKSSSLCLLPSITSNSAAVSFIPPVAQQLLTADDVKRTVTTGSLFVTSSQVADSAISSASAKDDAVLSNNINKTFDSDRTNSVYDDILLPPINVSNESDSSKFISNTKRNVEDSVSSSASESNASLFVVTKKVPLNDEQPLSYISKYDMASSASTSSSLKEKTTFVPKRRFISEREDDSGGDDLSETERAFLRQCAAGQVQTAERSIQRGVDVHVKNNFERDAMQICARNGSVPMLSMLLQNGGLLSSRGPKGDTLFHLAAWNGHVSAMRWLHQQGILPDAVDIMGQTVVHVAARRSELSVLQYLHEELNMDFNQLDFDGRMPSEHVARYGGPEQEACRNYFHMVSVKEHMREIMGNEVNDVND